MSIRRLSLGSFVVGASFTVFFLGFNWLIPFLRAPTDAGPDANQVLNRMSSVGAMAVPIGVVLMGLGYLGVILSPRVQRTVCCRTCGRDLRGSGEPRCPDCDVNQAADAERPPIQDTHKSDGDRALETEHLPAGGP